MYSFENNKLYFSRVFFETSNKNKIDNSGDKTSDIKNYFNLLYQLK